MFSVGDEGNKHMKKIKNTSWMLALLILAALALSSCTPAANPTAAPVEPAAPAAAPATSAPAAPAAAPTAVVLPTLGSEPVVAGKKILRVAYTREIDVLNAFTSQNLCDIEFTMVEGLVQNNDKGENIPILAKEIPTFANGGIVDNKDGTYDMTWNLQPGVKWHDGEAFTSKDVCFTWKFVSSEGSETYNSDDYRGIKDCKTPDDNTVVFHWDGLYGNYAGIFEAILPEHLLGKLSTAEIVQNEQYNRSPVGTGPFKFAEWKAGEYIRVVKNESYWRGADYPKVDEIVFSFIPDDNTRLNAIKTGDYNIGEILPLQVKEMKDNQNGTVKLIDSNSFMHFDPNVNSDRTKKLFGDVKVRQALYYAIDRKAIADQLMEGTVTVINSPLNPNSVWYNKGVKVYDYNVALAKQMLDEAGWVPGADGIRVKDGEKFSFTILNRAGKADRIAVAQVLQAQWKEIGVDVKFDTMESAAWTKQWRTGKWDAIVSGWFLPSDPSMTAIYSCGGSNNYTGLCDPKLDEAMKASDLNLDFDKRKPLIDQAQAILADDAFTLPIYAQVTPMYVSNNLTGFLGSGTNFGSYWNVFEWGLK
jgi:peptide/nickel transport system substrate-binding protein